MSESRVTSIVFALRVFGGGTRFALHSSSASFAPNLSIHLRTSHSGCENSIESFSAGLFGPGSTGFNSLFESTFRKTAFTKPALRLPPDFTRFTDSFMAAEAGTLVRKRSW